MPLPQAAPGGGRSGAHEHFRYVPTQPGAKWSAYVAGPCHWFLAHTRGRSKPCLHEMTGGELTCERCAQITPPQVIGYQPLYREVDSRPVMVIVYEYERDRCDALKLHQRVTIGREDQQSDGVWVTVALNPRPVFHTTLKCRMAPVDLTSVLLKLWGLPDLTAWYEQTHGKSDSPVSLAPTAKAKEEPKQSNGQPFGPMYRRAAVRAAATDDDSVQEAMQRALQKAKEREQSAAKNGKHKPGEGGDK
jgi:hypothetical protein